MKRTNTQPRILQFRLSVMNVKPEIWRKLLVSEDTSLAGLHSILQILMGWRNNHLFAFVIDQKRYSPRTEGDDDSTKINSIDTKLSRIFAKGEKRITYEYDFGDGWEIELISEPKQEGCQQNQRVECIEGGRHGPAEDTGGSRGYMEKAKIYGNPHHRRYREIQELIGPGFDPEAFDIALTNQMLREIA
jgi:hypothetical protein